MTEEFVIPICTLTLLLMISSSLQDESSVRSTHESFFRQMPGAIYNQGTVSWILHDKTYNDTFDLIWYVTEFHVRREEYVTVSGVIFCHEVYRPLNRPFQSVSQKVSSFQILVIIQHQKSVKKSLEDAHCLPFVPKNLWLLSLFALQNKREGYKHFFLSLLKIRVRLGIL